MTKRRDEELGLQDYLDGRLPEAERERFEARLEQEPELARRVAACREIGDSLREADEELSPGFYTRARAAFEEASKGGEPRRWFRPLSWETAGLAAVVLVAAVLYVPELVRAPSGREAFAPPPEEASDLRTVTLEEEKAAGDVAEDELARRRLPAEPEATPAPSDLDESPVLAGQAAPSPPSDTVRAQLPPTETEGLGAVAKKEAPRTGAGRDKGEDREAETTWAPAPPVQGVPEPAPLPPPTTKAEGRTEKSAAERTYTEADAARQSVRQTPLPGGSGAGSFVAAPLPSGLVEAGALVVVDDPKEWRLLLAESDEALLGELGGYDPSSRLVLVGTRAEPFDCATLSVVATGTEYWLLLSPPAEGGRTAEHGCALLLPRDQRTIEIGPGPAD
jgi:hypothetical protein